MYISVENLFFIILSLLGAVALVFLIIFLNKAIKFIGKIDSVIGNNEHNINKLMSSLPEASDNVVTLTENLKDVSEVVTSTTADVIDTKENISEYLQIGKDVFAIIKDVFLK